MPAANALDAPARIIDIRRPDTLPDKDGHLIDAASEIAALSTREAGALGFGDRLWAQFGLPYKNPGNIPYWERRNGPLTMTIQALSDNRDDNGERLNEYPYGLLPRLVLLHLSTQAIKTKDPEIDLGSIGEFMGTMGMKSTGGATGTLTRMREQTRRLAHCQISVSGEFDDADGSTRRKRSQMHFADGLDELWKSARPGRNQDQRTFWPETIRLSQQYFDSIIANPVPIDLRALNAVRISGGSGMAIDILLFCSSRLYAVKRETHIPWELLAVQFGNQAGQLRDFRRDFTTQLKKVMKVYPEARIEPTQKALILRPSPPMVAPR